MASAAPVGSTTKAGHIYFWKQRWMVAGILASQSRRPHSHPNQHTEDELKLIRDMRRRNPTLGMIELYIVCVNVILPGESVPHYA